MIDPQNMQPYVPADVNDKLAGVLDDNYNEINSMLESIESEGGHTTIELDGAIRDMSNPGTVFRLGVFNNTQATESEFVTSTAQSIRNVAQSVQRLNKG